MQLGHKSAAILGALLLSFPISLNAQQRTGSTTPPVGSTSTSTTPTTGTTAGKGQAGVGVSIDAGKAAKALIGILGKKKKKKAAKEAAATASTNPTIVKPTMEAVSVVQPIPAPKSKPAVRTVSRKPNIVSTVPVKTPIRPAPTVAKIPPTAPKQVAVKPRAVAPPKAAPRPQIAPKSAAIAVAAVAAPALAAPEPQAAIPPSATAPANTIIQEPKAAVQSEPAAPAIDAPTARTTALSINDSGTGWGVCAALLAAVAALFASAKTLLWPTPKLDCSIEQGNSKIVATSEAFMNTPEFNLDVDIGLGPTKFPNGLKLAN